MIFKKILWAFKRHPFLYRSRFKLLSKNSSIQDIEDYAYNQLNSKKDIPEYFNEVNDLIFLKDISTSDLERVKTITTWLVEHIKGGPGLSVSSEEALKIMLAGQGGVCSDMAQIFNNFCVINDVQVREWGCTRAPFEMEYGGHSFNEVYVKELNKWLLVDVYYGIMFYYMGQPLSVVELYQLCRNGEEVVYTSFIDSEKNHEASVHRNYLNPNTVPFLICNYSNKTYDGYLKWARPHIPVFIIHFWVYILGRSYHYRFPINDYKEIF